MHTPVFYFLFSSNRNRTSASSNVFTSHGTGSNSTGPCRSSRSVRPTPLTSTYTLFFSYPISRVHFLAPDGVYGTPAGARTTLRATKHRLEGLKTPEWSEAAQASRSLSGFLTVASSAVPRHWNGASQVQLEFFFLFLLLLPQPFFPIRNVWRI